MLKRIINYINFQFNKFMTLNNLKKFKKIDNILNKSIENFFKNTKSYFKNTKSYFKNTKSYFKNTCDGYLGKLYDTSNTYYLQIIFNWNQFFIKLTDLFKFKINFFTNQVKNQCRKNLTLILVQLSYFFKKLKTTSKMRQLNSFKNSKYYVYIKFTSLLLIGYWIYFYIYVYIIFTIPSIYFSFLKKIFTYTLLYNSIVMEGNTDLTTIYIHISFILSYFSEDNIIKYSIVVGLFIIEVIITDIFNLFSNIFIHFANIFIRNLCLLSYNINLIIHNIQHSLFIFIKLHNNFIDKLVDKFIEISMDFTNSLALNSLNYNVNALLYYSTIFLIKFIIFIDTIYTTLLNFLTNVVWNIIYYYYHLIFSIKFIIINFLEKFLNFILYILKPVFYLYKNLIKLICKFLHSLNIFYEITIAIYFMELFEIRQITRIYESTGVLLHIDKVWGNHKLWWYVFGRKDGFFFSFIYNVNILAIILEAKIFNLKKFFLSSLSTNPLLYQYFFKNAPIILCYSIYIDYISFKFFDKLLLLNYLFITILDNFLYNIVYNIKFVFVSLILQIINTLLVLLFVLVGGILPLWERKYLSLVQRRIGPKFVGYKGRLQFIADALKVLFKDYLYLYHTNKFFFFMLPIFFLNLNLLFFVNIIFYGNCTYLNIEYNVLFLMFFSMYSNIILFLVGYVSKNKYTILSSNRILNLFFINEMFISTIFLFIFLLFNSFSFHRIFFFKNSILTVVLLLPIIPLIFYLFLVDINKVPFDLVEAESELIMGYHVEYSGFLFGLFVLVEYLHLFFFIYILHILFSLI